MTGGRERVSFEAIGRLAELGDFNHAYALRAVCALGAFDHLDGGARSVDELGVALGAHRASLLRALRVVASRGVVTEVAPGVFELGPRSSALGGADGAVVQDALRLVPSEVEVWTGFEDALCRGEPAAGAPEDLRLDRAERAWSQLDRHSLPTAWDWSSARTVVDVGGASPTVAEALAAGPGCQGCAVPLPGTGAALPPGADAYLLRRVVTWLDDDEAGAVLGAVASSLAAGGRLFLVEPLWDGEATTALAAELDLLAVVLGRGGVRSRTELGALLAASGLDLREVRPAGGWALAVCGAAA